MRARLSEAIRRPLATALNVSARFRETPHGQLAPQPVDYSLAPHRPSRFWRSFTFSDPFHGLELRLGLAAGVTKLARPGFNAAPPGGPDAEQLPWVTRRNQPRGVYLPTQEAADRDAMSTMAPGQWR